MSDRQILVALIAIGIILFLRPPSTGAAVKEAIKVVDEVEKQVPNYAKRKA